MTPPADPTPADARALAEEAIRLAEEATPGPWHVSNSFDIECDTCGESPYVCDLTAEHEDGTAYQSLSMQFCGLESLAKPNAALVAHAGTHYATLARALLAALDERDHALDVNRALVDPKVLEMHLADGKLDVSVKSPMFRVIASALWRMLEGDNDAGKRAPNFVEMLMVDHDGGRMTITVRREGGKTPIEVIRAIDADLPHALGRCGCKCFVTGLTGQTVEVPWPEAHTAAVARLEGRIK